MVLSLQILQCLSIQGLTSSGGSTVGGDGGNSSGVSRALVKDRFNMTPNYISKCSIYAHFFFPLSFFMILSS